MTIWYRQGAASVENGSTAVVGTLTGWLNQVKPGDGITFDSGGTWHEVAAVESNTALSLATEYAGETVSSGAYAIDRRSPQWSLASDLAVKVAALLGSITTLILTSGKPNDGIGNNGAIAFDPEAQLFYFKAGSAWDEGTSIQGEPGPQGDIGQKGPTGNAGWTAVEAVIADDERRVRMVVDWIGGEGDKPATGKYLGASGWVDDIADAVNVRGPAGAGNGDVVGPGATVEDGEIAVFDGATGEAVRGSGVNISEISSIPDPVAMAIVFGA